MAYKFQVGQASLSGALEQQGEVRFIAGHDHPGEAKFDTLTVLKTGDVNHGNLFSLMKLR